jgi:hypothetical protein
MATVLLAVLSDQLAFEFLFRAEQHQGLFGRDQLYHLFEEI